MAFKLNYLLSVLIGSSKFISIMIGTLLFKSHGHENFTRRNIYLAFLMTLGVFVFHLGDSVKKSASVELLGVLLGLMSLVCDYLVSSYQSKLKEITALNFIDLLLGTNFWCLIFTIAIGLVKGEFPEAGEFIAEHPKALWDVFLISSTKLIGVYAIFYHIHTFGPVSLAYITTVRKVFTVVLSFLIYNHEMNRMRLVGVTVVFTVVFFDMFDAITKQRKGAKVAKTKTA